jgi:WD40 repeat protein
VTRSLNEILRWDLQFARAVATPIPAREQPLGLAISPAGQIAALDGADLLLVDDFQAAEPRRLAWKTRAPLHWSLALSSDGKLIAAGGMDGAIRLIDRASGDVVRTARGHEGVINVVAFSPDGRTLLSGGLDFTVRLWDVTTGEALHRFDGHTSMIQAVAFSADGESALSFARSMKTPKSRAEADRFVRVWNLKTGAQRRELSVPTPSVHAAVFTPDGQRVAALIAQELMAWDLTDGHELLRQRILPETAAPSCAAFSRDTRQLLVGGDGADKNGVSLIELNDALTQPEPKRAPE